MGDYPSTLTQLDCWSLIKAVAGLKVWSTFSPPAMYMNLSSGLFGWSVWIQPRRMTHASYRLVCVLVSEIHSVLGQVQIPHPSFNLYRHILLLSVCCWGQSVPPTHICPLALYTTLLPLSPRRLPAQSKECTFTQTRAVDFVLHHLH